MLQISYHLMLLYWSGLPKRGVTAVEFGRINPNNAGCREYRR
jgi:hypothetical protein